MAVYDKIGKEMFEKILQGKQVLHSNSAINAIANNGFGAAEMVNRMIKNGDDIGKAAANTFKNEAGNLNYAKIAGSYMGVAAGARVLSGGGAYKDARGNTNLIGVPFV